MLSLRESQSIGQGEACRITCMGTGLRIDEPVRRRPGAAARSLDCGHRRCKPNVLCADAMQMRCELLGVFPEVPVWIDV